MRDHADGQLRHRRLRRARDNHFRDKEALHADAWLAALRGYQDGFADALRESDGAEAGVKAAITYHLAWVAAHPDHARPAAGRSAP